MYARYYTLATPPDVDQVTDRIQMMDDVALETRAHVSDSEREAGLILLTTLPSVCGTSVRFSSKRFLSHQTMAELIYDGECSAVIMTMEWRNKRVWWF